MKLSDPILEQEEVGEDQSAAECVALVEKVLRQKYSPEKGLPMRRDAHPKHHGIVRARFVISESISPEFQHGVFSQPGREYPAWVRFSNGDPKVQADTVKDAHGMAIKIMGVEGERAKGAREKATQDFVMIDHPVFFIRNPREYVPFIRLQSKGRASRFFIGWNPRKWRLRQALIARRMQSTIACPLNNQYFSMSAYKLGPGAVKFSAKSIGAEPSEGKGEGPRYLHQSMKARLGEGMPEVRFAFLVQSRRVPRKMPIEDPTIVWEERLSSWQEVATLTIPAQDFASAAQMQFGEDVSYNPWNSLKAHVPLGGINRLRRAVYDRISELRHQVNGRSEIEPVGDESFASEDSAP